MPRTFQPRRAFAARGTRPSVAAGPVPACVVNAVLRYHDEAHDQGGGRSLLRLSARRLRDAEVVQALGELARRAVGVSILWNEREEEIIRVLEATPTSLAA